MKKQRFRTVVPVTMMATALVVAGCSQATDNAETLDDIDFGEEGTTTWEEGELPEDLASEINIEPSDDDAVEEEEGEEVYVERELYLLDDEDMVVPQTLSLPVEKGVLQQSLEYLVMDGPVTSMLPDGFQPVLPPGTEVLGVNLEEDGTAVADFSEEVTTYPEDREEAVLQAVTWTLTQYEEVDRIQILINGHEQEVMPVAETPVGDGWTREHGINHESAGVLDMHAAESHTLYFARDHRNGTYYVPVTKRMSESEDEFAAIVSGLEEGPSSKSPLYSPLADGVTVAGTPEIDDHTVSVSFESVSDEFNEAAMDALVLTLTELEDVEDVNIEVDEEAVTKEALQHVSEPVSRPSFINKTAF
ncbi:germination protein M [Salsuginibacillus halophilus]|uniref:Germination protein M n=1 Tax=Salsuginibacillus halophilus TaxID=517424 RepID=A0A2P8HCR1_9BACI|nr:GerMN domain-containing protein [Salsuginibacillus halophilus]PSL44019.1 germination protein M [Salsuginibacillus halophilus]